MKKKWLLGVLAIAMTAATAFGVSACGDKGGNDNGGSGNSSEISSSMEESSSEIEDDSSEDESSEMEVIDEETIVFLADGTVNFGKYPQTKVTDSATTSALTNIAGVLPTVNAGGWTSYGYYISGSNATDYMWYQDVEYGESKYRGVYFTSYRPYWTTDSSSTGNTDQDDNGYTTSTLYWFEYE